MEVTLKKRIQRYIADEMSDSIFYKELAKKAPNEYERKLLNDFALNEIKHISNFKNIYYMISGTVYSPVVVLPDTDGDYAELLRKKMLRESEKFRKYGEQYRLMENEKIKDAFYQLRSDKGVHALQLLYILNDSAAE